MKKRGSGWLQIGLITIGVGIVAACSSFSSKENDEEPVPGLDGGGAGEDGGAGGAADGGASASPLVVSLQAGPRVELIRGKRTDVVVQVTRRNGYVGEAVITARDLPQGVVAEPLVILAGEKSGTLGLTATEAVPHGVATPFVVASTRDKSLPSGEAKFDLVLRGLPGSVDESFGKKGIAELGPAGCSVTAVAAQTDGKVVYGCNGTGTPRVVVGRLQPNGSLDSAFGMQGSQALAFGAGSDEVAAVLPQSDGKVLVLGTAVGESKIGVARLTASGVLDTTFVGSGKTTIGNAVRLRAAALAEDGTVFVLASAAGDLRVGHVLSNGALDTTFGASGWATISKTGFAGAINLAASDLAISKTKIVVSFGVTRNSGIDARGGIASLARNGQGAPVLGETTVADVTQYRYPLVPRADGSTVVAFNSRASGAERTIIYGFLSDGKTQDANFGGGNPVILPGDDVPFGMIQDEAKRLVLVGQFYDSAPFKFRVLRQLPLGAPDTSFGTNGVSETLIGDEALATAVTAQKDGRIVVGGNRTLAAVSAPAFVRYWP